VFKDTGTRHAHGINDPCAIKAADSPSFRDDERRGPSSSERLRRADFSTVRGSTREPVTALSSFPILPPVLPCAYVVLGLIIRAMEKLSRVAPIQLLTKIVIGFTIVPD